MCEGDDSTMGSPKKIPLSKEVGQDWEAHREKGEVSPKLSSDELDRLLGDDTTDSVSMDTATSSISVSKDTISDDKGVSKDTDRVAYQRDFRKKRYKTVSLDMRPDEVKRFKECANAHGLSMTEFFRRAANAYIVSMDTAE